MRKYSAILLTLCFAGCASLPDDSKVVAFGAAVDNGISNVRQVGSEDANIALLWDKEYQAGRYMCGEEWAIVTKPSSSIDPKAIAFRMKRLEALSAYAAALKSASDKASIDKLGDAASNLIITASGFVSAAAPGAATLVAPIGKIVGKGVSLAIQDDYAKRVNAIIEATDPAVQRTIDLLVTDMSRIEIASSKTFKDWKIYRDVNLANMRIKEIAVGSADPVKYRCLDGTRFDPTGPDVKITLNDNADRGAAYDRLIESTDQEVAAEAAIKAASKSTEVLKKIASSHHALAQKSPDASSDIRGLVTLTDALADLVSAAKKGK